MGRAGHSLIADRPAPARTRTPARVAVMPAFNEAATILAVLDDLYPRVEHVIVVDDGSSDGTGAAVDAWSEDRDRCKVIHFPENRGLSAALRAGWEQVRQMLAAGVLRPDDVAFSIDADGQHEPAAIDGMIDHLVENGFDCVIGRRDLAYHTPYKVFGNKVMTWIGRLSGGQRFEDIESGYRVFRVGALLHAQEFYEGYRYSETVEVAVILVRLGYRVDNTHPVHIPVARTRTRLFDAVVDAVCMPLSWYRLACWRDLARGRRGRYAILAPVPICALAAAALALMLLKPFYLGDDSAHSYAHVWYLSESIFSRHQWPWHVAQLEDGKAVMFPYGFVPWLPDALLRPVLGDWAVTLSMVTGVVFMLVAMVRFRPAMKNPLLFALFLANPFLWNGVTQFQLTTFWAFAFFFLGVAGVEQERPGVALAGLALAFIAHPMMAAYASVAYAAWECMRRHELPRRFGGLTLAATVIASPAIFLMSTPAIRDSGRVFLTLSALDNVRRMSMVLLPMALPQFAPFVLRHHRVLYGVGVSTTAVVLVAIPPSGLWQHSQPRFADYLAEHPPQAGGSYRVMVTSDHEDGMMQFMKSGAVLANEFFTESQRRQSFKDLDHYQCLLATRNVSHVVVEGSYRRRYRTNEVGLLEQLAAAGGATLEHSGRDGTVAYSVQPAPSARRSSLRDCHL